VSGRVQLQCDGTRLRTGGEVMGKLANGVGSQYSYTPSQHGVSSITTADAHTSAASSRLKCRPRRFKWTRPFRRKTKSGFCACAITFQTQSTHAVCIIIRQHQPRTAKEERCGKDTSLTHLQISAIAVGFCQSHMFLRSCGSFFGTYYRTTCLSVRFQTQQ